MPTSLYLIPKYWRKHKKNLLALIFSSVLMTSIILVYWLVQREMTNRRISDIYSLGTEELTILNSNDKLTELVTVENSSVKSASAYMYGEWGDTQKFAYGTIIDPHNVMHIPFESGRMPTEENEVAVDRAVLDRLFWAGKCGDTIVFEEKTYTVVGIIDISNRYGSSLSQTRVHSMLDGRELENCEVLPLILLGKPEGEPKARIDYFSGIVDRHLTTAQAEESESFLKVYNALMENIDHEHTAFLWDIIGSGTVGDNFSTVDMSDAQSYLLLFIAGAAVAALSVFTVLRIVFRERAGNISILKRLGMSRGERIKMYAAECAAISLFQTVIGFIIGTVVYEGMLLFKTLVLGEDYISGITADVYVTSRSFPPYLISGIMSCAIMITAYILNLLTVNSKLKTPRKTANPHSLRNCFIKIFRSGTTTVVQITCLVVIIVTVTLNCMTVMHEGKYVQAIMLGAPSNALYAGGLDMNSAEVAEYYSCEQPGFYGVSYSGNDAQSFYTATAGYDLGIDDDTAGLLPEYAYAAGMLKQAFIISNDENNSLENKIDDNIKPLLTNLSEEKFQGSYDGVDIGSMNLYQALTCLADEKLIKTLSEYVRDGEIDIDALNSGREILVISSTVIPPFKAGESYTFGSAQSGNTAFDITQITVSKSVKIGAVIRLSDNAGELLTRLSTTRENSCSYNFLTTAKGAEMIGLDCAKYTEIFSAEEMNGSLIPSAAQMKLTSIKQLKQDKLIKTLSDSAWIIAVLAVMSLLGFSAYFNGIGMKIRQKSYEISVLRAQGMSVKRIRRTWLLQSLMIPFISAISAYAVLKVAQLLTNLLADKWDELWMNENPLAYFISDTILMKYNWWQANAEIPVIILWVVFSAVTALLTFAAMKRFGRNIAEVLNSGRTRK